MEDDGADNQAVTCILAPSRPSPFYALRSLAFVPTEQHLPPIDDGGPGAPTSARLLPALPTKRELAQQSGKDSQPQPALSDNEVIANLMKRRDALYSDQQRLDTQLRLVQQRAAQEAKLCQKAERILETQSAKVRPLSTALKVELGRIYEQQRALKNLRAELKELEAGGGAQDSLDMANLQSRLAGAATARRSMPETAQGSSLASPAASDTGESPRRTATPPKAVQTPKDSSSKRSSSRTRQGKASPAPLSARSLRKEQAEKAKMSTSEEAALGSPSVDSALLSVQAEMEKVTMALATADAGAEYGAGNDATKQTIRSRALRMELDDDEEADVKLLVSNGISLALLRHPGGSHALVDLRAGLIFAWRLEDGSACEPGSLPATWADIMDEESMPPWRLTLIDDSNNEPSVTLVCGGRGQARWRCQRTITLCGHHIEETLSIDNLTTAAAPVHLQERAYDSVMPSRPHDVLLPQEGKATLIASRLRVDTIPAVEDTGVVHLLEAGASWACAHRWIAQ
mmetsp:Transcript_4412/g.7609  ORF Transcript_4412/g.7609 Transcript_4412/m.7609 type:complete len:515 (-) Transcript_4412:9-1553(-)